ncbi:hypothetical protein [Cupriavidus laharis]|uniref:hypothetical protein n=1 Tax=Cupriavidus laharis TaxID=151654 RepID=UPI001CC63B9D|nr:hypothetical protein [Cupriavidus laharis]
MWTITAQNISWRIVPVSLDDLSRDVARLRKTLDLESGRAKPFDAAAAQRLYQRLLAPDANHWADAAVLNVTPYHALGELPFGVLLTSPEGPAAPANGKDYVNMPWLINKVAIVQQSSATAFFGTAQCPHGPGTAKSVRRLWRSTVQEDLRKICSVAKRRAAAADRRGEAIPPLGSAKTSNHTAGLRRHAPLVGYRSGAEGNRTHTWRQP